MGHGRARSCRHYDFKSYLFSFFHQPFETLAKILKFQDKSAKPLYEASRPSRERGLGFRSETENTYVHEFQIRNAVLVPVGVSNQRIVNDGAVATPRDGNQRPGDRQKPHGNVCAYRVVDLRHDFLPTKTI